MSMQYPFVRELYDAFQTGEFVRYDALVFVMTHLWQKMSLSTQQWGVTFEDVRR
jgi:hypothetical protein